MNRKGPERPVRVTEERPREIASAIKNYFGVPSIDAAMKQVKNLGGKLITEKMAVPGMGYLCSCLDTEGNTFGLWEDNPQAG